MAHFPKWLCFMLHLILPQSYILPSHKDLINDNKKDWTEAESYCLSTYNSHLLSIHDSHSFQALRNKIISIGQDANHFWIGLMNEYDASDSGSISYSYRWSDGTPFDFGTDISSGSFPWFDERPESPAAERYVRLWGGSASLLWDDTHADDEYFWICNDSPAASLTAYEDDDLYTNASNEPSESIEDAYDTTPNASISAPDTKATIDDIFPPKTSHTNETDENGAIFIVQSHADGLNLTTFWKFALFTILIFSTCIILLRLRIIYRAYSNKRRASSIGIGPRQITDLSAIESGTHSHLHKKHKHEDEIVIMSRLPFASIDEREDSLEICNEMPVIAAFAPSADVSSDDIPQVPTAHIAKVTRYDSKVSLEIEYDVTSHNSAEGAQRSQPGMLVHNIDSESNHSMIATFDEHDKISADHDIHMHDIEEQRRSILLIMQQNENSNETESYEEETSFHSSKSRLKFNNRSSCNSLHSTMAAYDARSYRMKDELFSDATSVLREDDGESMHMKQARLQQYVVSGETSDDCSETHIDNEDMDVPDLPAIKRESKISVKEIEIKSNISQIMENLKRMKNLSNDGNTFGMD